VHEAARPATTTDGPRLAELAAMARTELADMKGGPLHLVREARDALSDGTLVAELAGDTTVAVPGSHGRLVAVGTIDDVVVGYAVVRTEALRDGTILGVIDDLYVEPEARAVGVGEAIMELVLAWCQARGCRGLDAIALPGNRPTKNFFERFGLVARAIVVHRPLGTATDGA
jgi:GNAT superfamily N-acetyltransferase